MPHFYYGSNDQPVSRILVNNGATLNVLPLSMFRKVGNKKSDMLSTGLILTKFYGTIAQPLRVLSIELTVKRRTAETTFFVIDAAITYKVSLGRDWIHASRCIASSLHQYLIM